ncbi:unnamed protein product [Effrenium voratum]|nr:unnamed protein product [Effrenium voratum]
MALARLARCARGLPTAEAWRAPQWQLLPCIAGQGGRWALQRRTESQMQVRQKFAFLWDARRCSGILLRKLQRRRDAGHQESQMQVWHLSAAKLSGEPWRWRAWRGARGVCLQPKLGEVAPQWPLLPSLAGQSGHWAVQLRGAVQRCAVGVHEPAHSSARILDTNGLEHGRLQILRCASLLLQQLQRQRDARYQESQMQVRQGNEWCCANEKKACPAELDCQTDLTEWRTKWTTSQRLDEREAAKTPLKQRKQQEGYDCEDGLDNWEMCAPGWSSSKKEYCCKEESKGCFSCLRVAESLTWSVQHREYCCSSQNVACHDCTGDVRSFGAEKKAWCCKNEGRCEGLGSHKPVLTTTNCPDAIHEGSEEYCNSPIGTWPEQKKDYCCTHFERGCADMRFDCDLELHSFERSWSEKKKAWCCHHEKKGCPPALNCNTAPTSWSDEKQHICCHMHHIGCDLYQCRDATSPNSWTHTRRDWCCRMQDIGCVGFDCRVGVATWEQSWHQQKKEYCCRTAKVGCPPAPPPPPPPPTPRCDVQCNWDGQSVACRDRIKYAASHRFANQQHACTAAHHLVAGECSHCGQCTVEMSGCYVFWHKGHMHHYVTKHTHTHVYSLHDCEDGMQSLWSHSKKDYCCWKHRKGCPPPVQPPATGYDCDKDFDKWEVAWDATQQKWCCEHRSRACQRFQCDLGLENFQQLWGPPKKVWCCQNEHRGCQPGFTWFDCNEEVEHWERLWEPEKKGWCCAQLGEFYDFYERRKTMEEVSPKTTLRQLQHPQQAKHLQHDAGEAGDAMQSVTPEGCSANEKKVLPQKLDSQAALGAGGSGTCKAWPTLLQARQAPDLGAGSHVGSPVLAQAARAARFLASFLVCVLLGSARF